MRTYEGENAAGIAIPVLRARFVLVLHGPEISTPEFIESRLFLGNIIFVEVLFEELFEPCEQILRVATRGRLRHRARWRYEAIIERSRGMSHLRGSVADRVFRHVRPGVCHTAICAVFKPLRAYHLHTHSPT